MRVLQVIDQLDHGGTQMHAVRLARFLRGQMGDRVHVAALNGTGPLRQALSDGGVPVHDVPPLTRLYDAAGLREIVRFAVWIRRGRFDVVHTHDFYANVFGGLAARLARVPALVVSRRERGDLKTPWQRRALRSIYRLADRVVANATVLERALIEEDGVPAPKVVVCRSGIDLDAYARAAASRGSVRRALGIAPDARVATMVARLLAPKDPVTLLRAFAAARTPGVRSVLLLVGEGPLRAAAEALAGELDLRDHVRILGETTMVPDILAASDVGALSSTSEGLPNAVIECMAAGLPVVATDVGGMRELVPDERFGFLVAPGDVPGMASALAFLLGRRDAAAAMGRRCRTAAEAAFDARRNFTRVRDVYRGLLSGQGMA
jgi:glycosyltransferase involved in cell wall biosynthesis